MVFEREYTPDDVFLVLFVVQMVYCTQSYAMPSFPEGGGGIPSDISSLRPPLSFSFSPPPACGWKYLMLHLYL